MFTNVIMMSNISFFFYALISTFAAIIGDFVESFLKRCGDVKDSGSLFPGHGGLLDRIDSLSLCVPVVYFFVNTFI